VSKFTYVRRAFAENQSDIDINLQKYLKLNRIIRIQFCNLLSMEPWVVAKKSFKLVWRCHQLLSGFLANDLLPRVSRQSPKYNGDNEMIPGSVHTSPGI
jgi:hypothetical protein